MERLPGRRLVLGMYAFTVALAGAVGIVLGLVVLPNAVAGPVPDASLGPVRFPITPVTLAAYGMLAVGVGLGGLLAAVAYVAEHVDEPASPGGHDL